MLWSAEKTSGSSSIASEKSVAEKEAAVDITDDEGLIKKSDAHARVIISKAREILDDAQDFLPREVLSNFRDPKSHRRPTAPCWALTVIVKYDPQALEFFESLFDAARTPAQQLYAIAGYVAINREQARKVFTNQRLEKYADNKVVALYNNDFLQSTVRDEAFILLLTRESSVYIFERLPSFFSTTDMRFFKSGLKEPGFKLTW